MSGRKLPDPPAWARQIVTVGVTGTNGKTTTTTWAGAALAHSGEPVITITSVGSFLDGADGERLDVGLDYAGFIDAMRIGHERGARRAAIELTSEALAAGFALAWPCTVGVLTSFDHDHLDAHGSPEHYLASKAQLFVNLPSGGAAVLNAGEPASRLIAEVVPAGVRILRYGLIERSEAPEALDVAAISIRVGWNGTRIALGGRSEELPAELTTRAIGDVFAENALAALTAAIACGISGEQAARAIAAVPAPPGRFELVARRPAVVIDYAHTPDALSRTLASARQLCDGRLWLVFGVGGNRDRTKRGLMGQAARGADRVIVTNDNPRSEDPRVIADDVVAGIGERGGTEVELDRALAIERAVRAAEPADAVVIAGRGREEFQVIGGERRPLSDREIALRAHALRR